MNFEKGVKPKLIIISGAGISAESGISTFRDSNGLWENHRIEDVASPEGFDRNPELVLEFYNRRRAQLAEVEPNEAHIICAELEGDFDVTVVTQNVDDLHERGGSNKVIHLHGELVKARSIDFPNLIYDIGYKALNIGDSCEKGSQLRPHIVWFGEMVPLIDDAADLVDVADVVIVVGTSLQVYPAAGLIHYARKDVPIWLIDPKPAISAKEGKLFVVAKKASEGMREVKEALKKYFL